MGYIVPSVVVRSRGELAHARADQEMSDLEGSQGEPLPHVRRDITARKIRGNDVGAGGDLATAGSLRRAKFGRRQ